MTSKSKEAPSRIKIRTTGEFYNADLSTIKLGQLSAWADDNPHLLGRISGYAEKHPLMTDAQMEAFQGFVEQALNRYEQRPPLGAVYRFEHEEGKSISTDDLALEKSLRIIARANLRLAVRTSSPKAEIAQ